MDYIKNLGKYKSDKFISSREYKINNYNHKGRILEAYVDYSRVSYLNTKYITINDDGEFELTRIPFGGHPKDFYKEYFEIRALLNPVKLINETIRLVNYDIKRVTHYIEYKTYDKRFSKVSSMSNHLYKAKFVKNGYLDDEYFDVRTIKPLKSRKTHDQINEVGTKYSRMYSAYPSWKSIRKSRQWSSDFSSTNRKNSTSRIADLLDDYDYNDNYEDNIITLHDVINSNN